MVQAAPEDASGLLLRFSAGSLSAQAPGGAVSQWKDSVGGVELAAGPVQPRYKADGINGKPALGFASGQEYFSGETPALGGDEGLTVFIVCKPSSAAGMLASQGRRWNVRGTQFNVQPGTGNKILQDVKATWLSKYGEKLNGQAFCLVGVAAPGQHTMAYVNGEMVAQSKEALTEFSPGDEPLLIGNIPSVIAESGAQFAFSGEIAEVLIYGRALSDDERKQVTLELMEEYGLHLLGLRAP